MDKARPAATGDDISLGIRFGDAQGRPIPGTTANGLHFILFFDVATTTGLIQPVTLSVGLPTGLHWRANAPEGPRRLHGEQRRHDVVQTVTPKVALTTPTVSRAGRIVSAAVHVTADGAPALPTHVACAATVGGTKLHGSAHSADGLAICRYTEPRSGRGNTLHGTITVTADGTTLTRAFSIKLR
jgi:hypothetical protein